MGVLKDRRRLCRHCGELHSVFDWPDNHRDPAPARSDHPAPFVIRDDIGGINGLFHHGDGKRYDSKSAYRQATRDSGCIEAGGERPQDRSSFRSFEPQVSEQEVFADVCRTLAEHDVSVGSGELV